MELLFQAIETGSALDAMKASEKLAQVFDDSMVSRLERLLDTAPLRGLPLAGELATDGSARLLLSKLPAFLSSGNAEVARMAAVASGLRRLRAATGPILEHFEKIDGKAALRALGRIWERKLDDPPLPRADEIHRLSVLTLAHRVAMGAASSVEACETMFKVMTRVELEDYLRKHAGDRFYARRNCDEAARRKGFDPAKGARVHEALLASPDADLVAGILANSPHELCADAVRPLLKDERKTEDGRGLRDLAARRLRE